MRHEISFDVLNFLEIEKKTVDRIELFLFGIPSRLPDTKLIIDDLLQQIDYSQRMLPKLIEKISKTREITGDE